MQMVVVRFDAGLVRRHALDAGPIKIDSFHTCRAERIHQPLSTGGIILRISRAREHDQQLRIPPTDFPVRISKPKSHVVLPEASRVHSRLSLARDTDPSGQEPLT